MMSFSFSTFTVEVDHAAAIVFQAKWHTEAEHVCQEWLSNHWNELAKPGPGGVELPPIFKLRLARPSERAAYSSGGFGVEFLGDTKIVKLVGVGYQPEQQPVTEPSDESKDVHDNHDDSNHDATDENRDGHDVEAV